MDKAIEQAKRGDIRHDNLILETLLDIRDLLSVKSKSRRLLLEEIPMTERERELLNSLEEKE